MRHEQAHPHEWTFRREAIGLTALSQWVPPSPFARGRKQLEETLERAAANYREGEVTEVELVATSASGDLACVVEVQRGRAKVGGGHEVVPLALRATSLFRRESGTWKLVHRHADPITTPRPGASVIRS
jgi:ketosteroid isomerase-like protein